MALFISVVTVAFSLLFHASGKTNISSDLSYDCTKENSMKIFMSKPGLYGSVYAQGANGTKCSVEKQSQNSSFSFEIKDCDINKTIKVIIMHVIQNGSADDVVIGGANALFFELKCNEVPIGGYVINKTVTFTESPEIRYTPFAESPLYLAMEIKDSNHAPLQKAAIVGSMLYLVISGSDQFLFRADNCIASDAEHKHSKILVSNGLSVEMYILTNFSTQDPSAAQHNYSVEATLYAFHFAKSHDVEIMCTITVCQKNDDTCPLTTKSTGSAVRKRRDALPVPQTQTLRTTFIVVDKFENNNGIVRTSGAFRRAVVWLPLIFLAICAVRTLM